MLYCTISLKFLIYDCSLFISFLSVYYGKYTNSSDKLDIIIKSINEMKSTQNKLIASVSSFRDDKKLLDNKLINIDGKLNTISKQFNEILANNVLLKAKFGQLKSNFSRLEAGCN